MSVKLNCLLSLKVFKDGPFIQRLSCRLFLSTEIHGREFSNKLFSIHINQINSRFYKLIFSSLDGNQLDTGNGVLSIIDKCFRHLQSILISVKEND